MKETVIISLGGSLIYPKKRDYEFLNRFNILVDGSDKRFVLICGGGALARKLQKIFFFLGRYLKDWLGVFATRRNAKKVHEIFTDVYPKIVSNPSLKIDFKEKILIASGWKPGWSTDYDAVLLAENLGVRMIINMSNVDYVYDKDPNKFSDAKILEKISWSEFKKIVGDEWKPGLNMPFDPIASKKAAELGLKVVIIGKDLENLKKVLDEREFEGTIIQ